MVSIGFGRGSREIGMRTALGASRSSILRTVFARGMRLAAAGVGVGLLASLGSTALLRSLLFGVGPLDPVSFAVVAAATVLITLAASWLPARRATRLDPVDAMRAG